ncbi:MAG: hypothetical protein ACE5JP_11060 [Candidatus Bipolaricaulia bacterium]
MGRLFWKPTLFVALLYTLTAGVAYGRVELQVEIGFNGKYVPDRVTPIRVRLVNHGPPIHGWLTVSQTLESPWRGGVSEAMSREVSLEFNARKVFHFNFPVRGFIYPISVTLHDEMGTIAEQKIELRDRYERSELTLALSEVSFPTVLPTGEWVETVGPDRMPEEWSAYESVGRIYLGRLLLSALSSAQQEALRQWVAGGGELVVLSGDNWYFQRSPLIDALAPFTVTGLTEIESGYPITIGHPKQDATVLLSEVEREGGHPILVRGRFGSGRILFATVNPLSLSTPDARGLEALWNALSLSQGNAEDGRDLEMEIALDFNENPAFMPLNQLELRQPSRVHIGGLLIVYIAGFSMLGWLIARTRSTSRSRYYTWAVFPWLIIISSILLWYVHQPRFSKPVKILEMGIVRSTGGETALEQTWMGMFSKLKTDLHLTLNLENGAIRQLLPQERADHQYDLEYLLTSDQTGLLIQMDERQRRHFYIERFVDLPVTFSLNDQWVQVDNRSDYDLLDVGLVRGRRVYRIGTVAAGSSVTRAIERSSPGYLDRDNRVARELLRMVRIDGGDRGPLLLGWIVEQKGTKTGGERAVVRRVIGSVSDLEERTAIKLAVIEGRDEG